MIVPLFRQPPSLTWRWRTAREGDLHPRDMRTTHLFYTLRLIWNAHMPERVHVEGRLVRFGPRHPEAYLREAIVEIGRELFRRDDLPAHLREQLEAMARSFQLSLDKV